MVDDNMGVSAWKRSAVLKIIEHIGLVGLHKLNHESVRISAFSLDSVQDWVSWTYSELSQSPASAVTVRLN